MKHNQAALRLRDAYFCLLVNCFQGDEAQEDGSCDHEESEEVAKTTGSSLPVSPMLGDRDKTSDKVNK